MFGIEAVRSLDDLLPFRQVENGCCDMPPAGAWIAPENIALIAVGPDGPVGAILLTPCRQVGSMVTKFRLGWLYVLPEHRQLGLSRRLIQTAGERAAELGASTIQIPVKPDNETGLSWSNRLPKIPGLGFVVSLDRCGGF